MVSYSLPIHAGQQGNSEIKRFEQPERIQAQDPFMQALLELPCEFKHRNPVEWACSILIHVVVITAMLIAPLYFTQEIDLKALENTWLVLPAPPGPPPPPAAPQVQRVTKSLTRLIHGGRIMVPSVIPKRVAMIREEPLPPDTGGGVEGGVPGGVPGGQLGGVLGGIIGGGASPAVAVVAPPPPVKRILRVGGNVKPPRQIYEETPKYPFVAKQAHIQGVVLIDATIDEEGNVVRAHVVSGPSLLMASALEAVANWKYEPTSLNGEPISVQMHVEVHFTLQ